MSWVMSLLLLLGSWNVELQDKVNHLEHEVYLRNMEAELYGLPYEQLSSSEITLLPDTVYQGDAVLVRSSTPAAIEWQGLSYELKPFGKGHYALLPVSIDHTPGTYKILGKSIKIKDKQFEASRIQVTAQQEAMRRNYDRISKDQAEINKARSSTAGEFLYSSNFLLPVEKARLTTPYGYTRYVNGKLSGIHRAIDLAAPTGTPVKATNNGIVVLADELYLTGNSIYIDHGMNLFSQYAHLDQLNAAAGDEVKAGDIIGTVGSTGFSTGPHLHFTFWIGNHPVNPNLFFDQTPFHWQE
jgi:murein DD-endopeptidase MepM/ murein hydrolase activator NlpD